MTKVEQKKIVQQQQDGFRLFKSMDIEAERKRTPEQRLEAFTRILKLAEALPKHQSREDDDQVTQTWIRLRDRYDSTI